VRAEKVTTILTANAIFCLVVSIDFFDLLGAITIKAKKNKPLRIVLKIIHLNPILMFHKAVIFNLFFNNF